jgi:hypothetical protein
VRKLSLWLANEEGVTVSNESTWGLPTPALGQLTPHPIETKGLK